MWKHSRDKVVEINSAADSRDDDISLFRGGPFYRAQAFIRLIGPGRWNLGRRVAVILAIAWLPLVILTAVSSRDQLTGLLRNYMVYSRIVMALPVLLIGQSLMDDRSCAIIGHIRKAKLLGGEDLGKLNSMMARLRRWRDSVFPELLIVVLIYLELALVWKSKLATAPNFAVYRDAGVARLTYAGWYYGMVSLPIYQFLLALNLWKWLVWSFVLVRLSRMDLKLVATHPDAHGGLGFLGLSAAGFTPIAFAVSAAIGGDWRNRILNYGATLSSFRLPAIILFVLMFTFALASLSFFVIKLTLLRKRALLDYGVLAQSHVVDFHEKWFSNRESNKDPHFTVQEVSALADLTIAYGHIRRMRPFPADISTLVGLALALAAPLFPVVLAEIPFSVIVKGLFEAVKAVPL
jgi:hypothetical protein